MKKISKRVRDQAILMLDIGASTPSFMGDIADDFGACAAALDLTLDAYIHCENLVQWRGDVLEWAAIVKAEAAQLLREGWTP